MGAGQCTSYIGSTFVHLYIARMSINVVWLVAIEINYLKVNFPMQSP